MAIFKTIIFFYFYQALRLKYIHTVFIWRRLYFSIFNDLAEAEAELVAGYNMCGERSTVEDTTEDKVAVSCLVK